MNINELKNKNFSSLSERDYQINNFVIEARVAFAKSKGLYHSVEDPEGLKEITPGLAQGYITLEYFNKILKDGRVHKMMHEFTQELKAAGIIYYYGIDGFLETYKKAVYGCLKNIEED